MVTVKGINIRAVVEQHFDCFTIASPSGPMQSCCTTESMSIHRCQIGNQMAHTIATAE